MRPAPLPPRYRLCLALVALALAAGLPGVALATPYWTAADRDQAIAEGDAALPTRTSAIWPGSAPASGIVDYQALFAAAAAFIEPFQVSDAQDPEFGGMREAEHLLDIVQTDNTSESIWVWTRYFELTGDNQYEQNVQDAFTYSLNFPAYDEEGGSFPFSGYYRMYNCGWAAFAEWYYRSVTGDTTYKWYGDSCASYIANKNLNRNGAVFDQYVNPPVLSWAAGNLWIVADAQGNQAWKDAAAARGKKVKGWVDGEPSLLYDEEWAMSGGATMWGILNSHFKEEPESLVIWTDLMRDSMETYSTDGQFTNAWNGWYALGQHALWENTLYEPARLRALALSDTLIAEDGDADGGIAGRPSDADTMDQTWVTNYLSRMALNPWIALTGVGPTPSAATIALASSPNPFGREATIRFAVPRPGRVALAVFDVSGRRVRELVEGTLPAGEREVRWDGRDEAGRRTAAGSYLLRLTTPQGSASRRVVYMR